MNKSKPQVYLLWRGEEPIRARITNGEKIEFQSGDVKLCDIKRAENLSSGYKHFVIVSSPEEGQKAYEEYWDGVEATAKAEKESDKAAKAREKEAKKQAAKAKKEESEIGNSEPATGGDEDFPEIEEETEETSTEETSKIEK